MMDVAIELDPEVRPRRRVHSAGAIAVGGGALMIVGAFLPWLSVFEGLQTIHGVAGPNGRALALLGALAIVAGGLLAVRGGRRLGVAVAIGGAVAASFAVYLVAQVLVTMRGLDGMMLARIGPGVFVSASGALLVAGSILAPETRSRRARVSTRVSTLRNAVALASVGAGVIHLAVAPDHLREWVPFGVSFIVLGVGQLAWSARMWTRPSRRVVLAGAIGNALVVGLWIVSRTSGIPVGPQHWSPEAAGFADIVCTAYEVLIVAGAALLLRGRDRELGRASGLLGRVAPVLVGAPLTIAAVVSAAGVLGSGPMHM